jgi:plastocyanin
MRNLFIMITGFVVSGAGVLALALALPQGSNSTTQQAISQQTMPMSGMASMSSRTTGSASLASVRLTIRHVQRGCHVWAHGNMTGAMMRLHLRVGQRLSILDQDVDAHQMLQFAGPMRLHMGRAMMTNHGMAITFSKKGVYRLGTKTVEMPGMGGMDVKTIGPDNKLRLVVTVA